MTCSRRALHSHWLSIMATLAAIGSSPTSLRHCQLDCNWTLPLCWSCVVPCSPVMNPPAQRHATYHSTTALLMNSIVHGLWNIKYASHVLQRAQGLKHAAHGSDGVASPVPRQLKNTMHSWQRTLPQTPMAAAIPHPSLRRSLVVTSRGAVQASAESFNFLGRSLVDAGLLHGASTRVSWTAGGKFTTIGEHCWKARLDT